MRVPRLGLVIVCFACAGLLSGEAFQITTTPSHTPTQTPTPTPTPTTTATLGPTVIATPKPTPWPAGSPEIPVNSSTSDNQQSPSIAATSSGGFVVVWTGPDGDGSGVFGRRFDQAGAPLGPDFPVNTLTTSDQSEPSVAADDSGNFVVVWSTLFNPSSGSDIVGQRYDAAGAPLGGEVMIHAPTTAEQHSPRVARTAEKFVVVWEKPAAARSIGSGWRPGRHLRAGVRPGRPPDWRRVPRQRCNDRKSAFAGDRHEPLRGFRGRLDQRRRKRRSGSRHGARLRRRRRRRVPDQHDDDIQPGEPGRRIRGRLRRHVGERRPGWLVGRSFRQSGDTRPDRPGK